MVARVMMALFLGSILVSWSNPVQATPILFTDRAAFDAYVGSSTFVGVSNPIHTVDPSLSTDTRIYDGLVKVTQDSPGPAGIGQMGWLRWGVQTLVPVTAFGMDIVRTSGDHPIVGGVDITDLSFIGYASSTPFIGAFGNGCGAPVASCMFTISGFAVKSVPEPSAFWLLAIGLISLLGWHMQRVRLS